MRLILVRHGQTPHNITGALDTTCPGASLTPLGEAQAAALTAALADAGAVAVYASPLVRTQQTAAPLAASLELRVGVREGFEEISAGDLELRHDAAAITAYLDCVYAWSDGDLEHHMPGAPDGHAFLARYDAAIRAAVAQAATEHDEDSTLVVVSHGAAIRTWTSVRAVNAGPGYARRHRLSNTGAATFAGSPDQGWTLVDWHAEALGGPALASRGIHDVTGGAEALPV